MTKLPAVRTPSGGGGVKVEENRRFGNWETMWQKAGHRRARSAIQKAPELSGGGI